MTTCCRSTSAAPAGPGDQRRREVERPDHRPRRRTAASRRWSTSASLKRSIGMSNPSCSTHRVRVVADEIGRLFDLAERLEPALAVLERQSAAPSTTERSEIRSAARSRIAHRSCHGVAAHPRMARRAASTTSSTSWPSASVKCPITNDVSIGETVVNDLAVSVSSSPIHSGCERPRLTSRRLDGGVVGGLNSASSAERWRT